MPLLKKWIQQDAIFGIWHVTEPFEWFRSHLTSCQSYNEELQNFRSATRRLEYVATRILLRELYGKEAVIGHRNSGKPFLLDTNIHITISHTQGYIALGICPSSDIGIDIEYRSDRILRIQDRFLSDYEKSWCLSSSRQDTVTKLLLCWTAKETLYKILDRSGINISHDITISPATLNKDNIFFAFDNGIQPHKRHRLFYDTNDEYTCSWTIAETIF